MKFDHDLRERRANSAEEQAAHLKALIECTRDLIWSIDLDYRLVTFNQAYAENIWNNWGVVAQVGMRPADLTSAANVPEWVRQYERVLTEGPYSVQYKPEGGQWLDLSFNPVIMDGKSAGISVFAKDITESKRSDDLIKASEARFRALIENAPCAVGVSRDDITIFVNRKFVEMFRLNKAEDETGLPISRFWAPECRKNFEEWTKRRKRGEAAPTEYEGVGLRADGSEFSLRVSSSLVELPDGPAGIGFLTDETEHREAERALRESEAHFRSYFDLQLVGMVVTSPEKEFLELNDRACQILGYPREELLKSRWPEITHHDDRGSNAELFERMKTGEVDRFSLNKRFIRKDGSIVWTAISVGCVRKADGALDHVCTVVEDISERKAAEEAIQKAEQEYRQIFEQAPEGIFKITVSGKLLSLSPAGARMLGYGSSEDALRLIQDAGKLIWVNPSDRLEYVKVLEKYGEVHDRQYELKRKDGTPIWVSVTARRVAGEDGKVLYYQGYFENLSEKKRLEAELSEHLREVRVLSEMNEALLRAHAENELLEDYCRIIVETGGYRMAWVGFAEETPEKIVVPVAWFGHEDGYLSEVQIRWDGGIHSRGPTGRAILSGQIEVAQDYETDPGGAQYVAKAAKRGFRSLIAVPFRQSANSMACLTAYGTARNTWSETERRLMDQVASALGFGIRTLRTAIAKDQSQHDLRVSLEQTIQVIAETVDQRDPYTAGHQRRVADLCMHIARKMGLDEDRVHGLRLAASVHDLGKVSIPAEILSKPGKLTSIQYSLVKEHAQLGYEIIRGVHFPWPIAEMVRQHHERLDGSGYPRGLSGDMILLESRILAVADVVEAMASHRPYRPALGVDAALEEILCWRGRRYDADAVDACRRIFRDDGYTLPVVAGLTPA